MAHGGLSQAGKVKGRTPKVEPTEKPKKKTGRARRREQYNRRILNPERDARGRILSPNKQKPGKLG